MCTESLPSTVDHTPKDFSAVDTSAWLMVAGDPSGSGMSMGSSGWFAYVHVPSLFHS
jgi:hypothetical protein